MHEQALRFHCVKGKWTGTAASLIHLITHNNTAFLLMSKYFLTHQRMDWGNEGFSILLKDTLAHTFRNFGLLGHTSLQP